MKIAIFSQFIKEKSEASFEVLLAVLKQKNATIYIHHELFENIKYNLISTENYTPFFELDTSFDLLISIGGDGTILRAITHVKDLNIPVVGINTGRLGFLATIQYDEIETVVNHIFNGNYKWSKRTLLAIETSSKNKALSELNFALNEIAISRKNTTSMITVETRLNGEYLTSYWSDGLIVSSPTGSTGYSLSCGGPVITPDTTSFVITPIAPHNLSARPLIIEDSTIIQLRVSGRENNYLISLDSRIATLSNDTIITIKKAPFTINMVELRDKRN